MTTPRDPNDAIDFIYRKGEEYANAKAERVYLEEFRKSKKALLMRATDGAKTIAQQERDAYSHPEYLQVLDGIKAAVALEEALRWQLVAAQARVDWSRTESANNRRMDRVTQ
jgi:hypothetical protein